LTADEHASLPALLLAFQKSRPVQELIAEFLAGSSSAPPERKLLVLETVARVSLAELPPSWAAALEDCLRRPEPAVRRQAVHTAAVLQLPRLDDALIGLAAREDEPAELRLEALRAVILRRPRLRASLFGLLLGRLDRRQDPLDRLAAAEILGRSQLDDAQLARLIKVVRGDVLVSPAVLLPALQRSVTRETAPALLDYLAEALSQGWRPGEADLDKTLAALPFQARSGAGAIRNLWRDGARRQRSRLEQLDPLLVGGDPGRGREVFYGKKANCAACHRADFGGGQIGPDLTRIGAVRAGRDLLESIVFPSSTIAQGFDSYAVVTREGQVVNGVISRQTADTLVLRDSSGAEIRLRRDAVEELARTPVSLMPDRLDEALTPAELRDLMAYLQSLK
jgi:putative heme-binding domain-containing protein